MNVLMPKDLLAIHGGSLEFYLGTMALLAGSYLGFKTGFQTQMHTDNHLLAGIKSQIALVKADNQDYLGLVQDALKNPHASHVDHKININ